MGNFHFPTKSGLFFITSSNHLATILNLHTVPAKATWHKNPLKHYDCTLEIKIKKCSLLLRGESLCSDSWLFWVVRTPAENTFPTVKSLFFPRVLRSTSLEFCSSVRISLTTKYLTKLMPFPETMHNLLVNFNFIFIPKTTHNHGQKRWINGGYLRDFWIQKSRKTDFGLQKCIYFQILKGNKST